MPLATVVTKPVPQSSDETRRLRHTVAAPEARITYNRQVLPHQRGACQTNHGGGMPAGLCRIIRTLYTTLGLKGYDPPLAELIWG